jgi:ABC-type nitrate/sulfonate/bicarbonate transport system substrate-binding protein
VPRRSWTTYTNAHPAETAAMMAEYTSVPVEKFQSMARAIEGSIVDADLMQPLIETMVKYGLTKTSFPARDMIDPNAATR